METEIHMRVLSVICCRELLAFMCCTNSHLLLVKGDRGRDPGRKGAGGGRREGGKWDFQGVAG